ncbi:small T antigen [Piliocolobus rufomitratus polyomavirus 1]|uniref:Small T antigen n=1 Tax=Piliocolobus rufomitratus polyomavirus 1 TaxID=1236407 RepID=K7QLH2_9POLY|nr:small T antigen [Piliocolobus rufomitratus polyomavirus 1]AFU25599.1 small T antigen [Piliocolobus rufomitratus polyomavirus 1]
MERVLQKSEKTQLMELLGIPKYAFGNFPIMKTAYKRASKSLHPDKGGSTEKMMLLNSLWQKFQEGFIELRNSEVCPVNFSDCYDIKLVKICGGPKRFNDAFLRSPQCLQKGLNLCKCITSLLFNQHDTIKLGSNKICLMWGECFCFYCFILWYGMEKNWETFDIWKFVIAEMPAGLLKVDSEISKYFLYKLL